MAANTDDSPCTSSMARSATVLEASDAQVCTYAQGSLKRQTLYACVTCCPQLGPLAAKRPGICLACSNHCHKDHELIELYTRRNFRCDCPTIQNTGSCQLNPELNGPQPRNRANLYNQNFQGLYCNCHRLYNDPRTSNEDIMQCVICEDWFHRRHLNPSRKASQKLDSCKEMICNGCMERHSFLRDYAGLVCKSVQTESVTSATVGEQQEEQEEEYSAEPTEPKRKLQKLDKSKAVNRDNAEEERSRICKRPVIQAFNNKGGSFWGSDWRAKLCRCNVCLRMYREQGVEFLVDNDDSIRSFEERRNRRPEGLQDIQPLAPAQQIEPSMDYNQKMAKFSVLFQKIATKPDVTGEEIQRYLGEMRENK